MRDTASREGSRTLAPSHLPAGVLRVDVVSDERELPALAAAWDELLDADPDAPGAVFRSAAWLLPWWKTFSVGRELRVYVARTGERLVGVLPAYRRAGGLRALGTTQLRLLGDGVVGSDYLGVIARPDDRAAAATAIAQAILLEEPAAQLDGLEAGDALAAALAVETERRSGAVLAVEPLLPCPFLAIPAGGAAGFEAWLKTLPDGAGAQLKRRRRWLEKQPGFSLDVATDEESVASALAALWRLHHLRWSVEGGSDAIDSPLVEQFHAAAARALARKGIARVYTIAVEGEPRAALYGFRQGRRFAFYQSGNDPAWRQRSVGTVVLGAAIEDAFATGASEFDFLRGNESYKATFASGDRQLVRARLAVRPRARVALALEDGLREARQLGKRLVGDGAVEWFRRQRRRVHRSLDRSLEAATPHPTMEASR